MSHLPIAILSVCVFDGSTEVTARADAAVLSLDVGVPALAAKTGA
jgi:hypothetical protein